MQAGTLLYSRRRSVRAAAVIIVMAAPVSGGTKPFAFIDAWERGRAGALFPVESMDPFGQTAEGGGFSLKISCSRPHDIRDLAVHTFDCALRGGAWECGFSWRRLEHDLYHENRLSLSAAAAMPLLPLHVSLEPALVRRAVSGSEPEGEHALAYLISAVPIRLPPDVSLSFGIEGRIGRDRSRQGTRSVLRGAISVPTLSVLVNRIVLDRGERETRIGPSTGTASKSIKSPRVWAVTS